jgi:hypothetical protein
MLTPFQFNRYRSEGISAIAKKTFSLPLIVGSLAASLAVVLPEAPAFAATASWSPEQVVATASQAVNVRTAVDASGISVVVWDQLVPGSIDTSHPYGINQVYASVCLPRTSLAPDCSPPNPFTDGLTDATNAGAVVAPSGTVTVFWTIKSTPTAFSESSQSSDSGTSWTTSELIPGDNGYTLLSGSYAQLGPSVGIDGLGNIIAVLLNPLANNPTTGASYSVQTLVKNASDGTWSAPVQLSSGVGIFGSSQLFVNSDGQALLNFGFTAFRRDSLGNWSTAQTVPTPSGGQVYSASAGLDAGGKGYFVTRTRYGGAFLSTSTTTTGWTTPKHIAKFDTLGSSVLVRGSSPGHAIVYGNDMNTGYVKATVTTDGGATWGNMVSFGAGSNPQAVGSENGLYGLSWSSGGATWDRYFVASGTGVGTGTTAWVKKNLIGNFATGPVAIKGNVSGGSAQTAAGWARMDTSGMAVGTALGTITP